MVDLRECPFCGGEAKISIKEGFLNRRVWYVCCKKCYVKTEGKYEPYEIEDYKNPYMEITKTVEDVVASWNRRANDDAE